MQMVSFRWTTAVLVLRVWATLRRTLGPEREEALVPMFVTKAKRETVAIEGLDSPFAVQRGWFH